MPHVPHITLSALPHMPHIASAVFGDEMESPRDLWGAPVGDMGQVRQNVVHFGNRLWGVVRAESDASGGQGLSWVCSDAQLKTPHQPYQISNFIWLPPPTPFTPASLPLSPLCSLRQTPSLV